MARLPSSRTALVACAALAGLAALAAPAAAQTVQMFDEAPPLEVLRSIMVPESHGGMTRRIVIPQANLSDPAMQPAAMSTPAPTSAPAPAASTPAVMRAPAAVAAPASAAPAPAKPAKPGIVGFRVNFAFDSDAIAPAYRDFVDRIGQLLQEEPQVKLRIEGHTDAVGADAYNNDLSLRRAVAVANDLVHRIGIAPDRLTVAGKGKSEPLAADPYDPHNRRVQFVRVN
jgi:outer membrane protein OmpA-like peptidoglycan-associated protein